VTSSIVVVDCDGAQGLKDFAKLIGASVDDVPTVQAVTPRGGRHLYLLSGGVVYKNAVRIGGLSIDIRAVGGYVVMPSPGNGRRWILPKPNDYAPLPEAIAALLKKKDDETAGPLGRVERNHVKVASGNPVNIICNSNPSRYGKAALAGACEDIRSAPNGLQRRTLNDRVFKIVRLIHEGELGAQALDALTEAALAMPTYDPRRPWTPANIQTQIDYAVRDGMRA
jgi:hypothetical protein